MSGRSAPARIFVLLRVVVGGIFVYAGAVKLSNPLEFADAIATFQLLPPQLVNMVALSLPPFEMVAGLLLVCGWKLRAAALGILVLTFVFAVALAQALVRGLPVDCGCFGSGETSGWKVWSALGRDILLMAAAAWIYRRATRRIANVSGQLG